MKPAIINDAIHSNMVLPGDLSKLLKTIIDNETFQRLRHIKQLGLAELIFPTATHNRFSHSLGAAHVAFRMSQQLGLNPLEQKYAIASALLHDIGHGPFSHDFEKILAKKNILKSKKISHEAWTSAFLKEYSKALKEAGLDYKIVSNIIRKQYTSKSKINSKLNLLIIQDIVSSQLDADRLDYLLRDSHFCGVPYGQIDIAWIINNLDAIAIDHSVPRIGIHKKGWKAVEHFLLARKLMTQDVYNHPKNSVVGQLVRFLLTDLSDRLVSKDKKKVEEKIANKNLCQFLKHVGEYRNDHISESQFIADTFRFYKTLTDYDIWMLIRDLSLHEKEQLPCQKIASRIYNRQIHRIISFPSSQKEAVEAKLKKLKESLGISNWEIFIIENQITSYESKEDPILIIDAKGKPSRISEFSEILHAIGDKAETETFVAIDCELKKSSKYKKIKALLEKL